MIELVPRMTGYSLCEETVSDLAREFVTRSRGVYSAPHKDFSFHIMSGVGPDALFAEAVEAASFSQEFGDRPEERRNAWRGYEHRSKSITAFQHSDSSNFEWYPRGTIRLVFGAQPFDFKSMVNLHRHWGVDPEQTLQSFGVDDWTSCLDVATLATDPRMPLRGSAKWMSKALLHCLYRVVQTNHIKWLVGILADGVYAELDRTGLGLISLGCPKDYMGVVSQPFLLIVDRLPQTLSSNPRYASMLVSGDTQRGTRFDEIFDLPTGVQLLL